jgi:hypothetical protein
MTQNIRYACDARRKKKSCEVVWPCHQCRNAQGEVDCVFAAIPMPQAKDLCETCKERVRECDRIFPACQHCLPGECQYLLPSGYEMRVARDTCKALPTGYVRDNVSFEIRDPVERWSAHLAFWPGVNEEPFDATLYIATQWQDTGATLDCTYRCGKTFSRMADLLVHCHPTLISDRLQHHECPLRYRTTCHFHYELGHSCLIRQERAGPAHNNAATFHQYDAVMHFAQGHAIYCYCGRPFDSQSLLAIHQFDCQLRLGPGEACSPLTLVSGFLPQVGFDADIAQPISGL